MQLYQSWRLRDEDCNPVGLSFGFIFPTSASSEVQNQTSSPAMNPSPPRRFCQNGIPVICGRCSVGVFPLSSVSGVSVPTSILLFICPSPQSDSSRPGLGGVIDFKLKPRLLLLSHVVQVVFAPGGRVRAARAHPVLR